MIQTPVIVTFANQKGGVGKTTLCVTFANYLVAKGVNVIVVDTDLQQSIFKNRKADIKKYGEASMPYCFMSALRFLKMDCWRSVSTTITLTPFATR